MPDGVCYLITRGILYGTFYIFKYMIKHYQYHYVKVELSADGILAEQATYPWYVPGAPGTAVIASVP